MRGWGARIGLALAATLALSGCGGEAGRSDAGTLRIYNWSDYIDPALLDDFTRETGVRVVYDTFDSNEVLETKVLQGDVGYDLVVPSNSNLPRYITAQAIEPLDKARLQGLQNLWPDVMRHLEPFDPGGAHAVPYMWGTIGIGYNRDAVARRLPGVNIDSWDFALDPKNLAKLEDCGVYFLDASEDMYALTLKWLGRNPNSRDLADYQAATDALLAARPFVRKFHSSEYINALASGDICLAVGYSGDIFQAAGRAADGVEVEYVIPREGSQVWFDVFAMPRDAPNPDAAYAFLNFMLRPEVIARASNHTRYANANMAATPLVDAAIRDNPNIYPTPEVFQRLFVTTAKDPALLREVNRRWTRVLTGQ